MKKLLLLLAAAASLPLLAEARPATPPPVRNVIYLIGDGMGLAQVSGAMATARAPLHLERATAIGLIRTSSASHYVTDSAAAGTALSSGYKTTNGFVGMRPDKSAAPTLLELAQKAGKATGVIATCSVTHATPGAFLAHQESRKLQEEIAEDITRSGVDLLVGGGRKYFETRKDGRDLSATLRSGGTTVAYTLAELLEAPATGKVVALLAEEHLPPVAQGRDAMLETAVANALQRLSASPNGFFLMVEGSQIDWGGHKQDAAYTISETLDFDRSVRLAMDFADKHPGTLVVVTADHETGGMALVKGDLSKHEVEAAFPTKSHTGIMVPVYAYGTGAAAFSGVYENTDIFHRIVRLYLPGEGKTAATSVP